MEAFVRVSEEMITLSKSYSADEPEADDWPGLNEIIKSKIRNYKVRDLMISSIHQSSDFEIYFQKVSTFSNKFTLGMDVFHQYYASSFLKLENNVTIRDFDEVRKIGQFCAEKLESISTDQILKLLVTSMIKSLDRLLTEKLGPTPEKIWTNPATSPDFLTSFQAKIAKVTEPRKCANTVKKFLNSEDNEISFKSDIRYKTCKEYYLPNHQDRAILAKGLQLIGLDANDSDRWQMVFVKKPRSWHWNYNKERLTAFQSYVAELLETDDLDELIEEYFIENPISEDEESEIEPRFFFFL